MSLFDLGSLPTASAPPTQAPTAGESATTKSPPSTAAQGQPSSPVDVETGREEVGTLRANGGKDPSGKQGNRTDRQPTVFVKAQGAHHAEDDESWKEATEARTLNGYEGGPARSSTLATAQAWETRVARNGRGAPSGTVNALKAQAGETGKGDAAPMALVPAGAVRRLTPTETERLQGFPDGWTAIGK